MLVDNFWCTIHTKQMKWISIIIIETFNIIILHKVCNFVIIYRVCKIVCFTHLRRRWYCWSNDWLPQHWNKIKPVIKYCFRMRVSSIERIYIQKLILRELQIQQDSRWSFRKIHYQKNPESKNLFAAELLTQQQA